MLINQDFTVDRTKYIGGSDIGAILGLSPYRTPLEVWLEKTGKKVKQIDSLPLRFGSFAEEFVAAEYSRASSRKLLSDPSIHIHPNYPQMSAHIDRFILGDGDEYPPTGILECKTANPFSSHHWGEAGTDQVPMSYLCQCIWYMAITQLPKADLAVLFGNSDFRIYEISRDLALEEMVIGKALSFWNDYVLQDIPPPPSNESDYQMLFSKGNSSKSVEATKETVQLICQLQELTREMQIKEGAISTIKQSLMSEMGEAELLTYAGQVLATWKAPKPSFRVDTKRLEAELPEIAQTYKTPIQNSRRLVIKDISQGDLA